jgi:hypothetical protein
MRIETQRLKIWLNEQADECDKNARDAKTDMMRRRWRAVEYGFRATIEKIMQLELDEK